MLVDREKYMIAKEEDREVINRAHLAALEQRKKINQMIEERGRVTEPPGLGLPDNDVQDAIRLLQEYTAPASQVACRRRIEQLRKMLGASRMSEEYTALLAKAIGHLPVDLLDQGMVDVVRNRTYKAMPTPAEWTGPVDTALRNRKSLLSCIRRAESESASPEPTDA